MWLVIAPVEFEMMPDQALLQRPDQLRQLLRQIAWCGMDNVIVSPVASSIETQSKMLSTDFLCRQLQRFQPACFNLADKHQRAVQRFAAHGSATAQLFQRHLPRSQFLSPGGSRP